MTDLFAVEPLLIARLRDRVTGLRLVRGVRSAAEIPEQTPVAPAAYVMLDGHAPVASAGANQVVRQRWLVVLVVRHNREFQNGAGERLEAGPLLAAMASALIGWQPLNHATAMATAEVRASSFKPAEGHHALAFSLHILL